MSESKEAWGSRVGLILAMAGNAVGLGNFLRFPVQAINNGGGAFIIPYLICFVLLGLPLLWMEWSMGRFGGTRNNHSTPFILDSMTHASFWKYFGVFGIFTNVAVAAYYCYIESWTMSYVYHSLIQTFSGMDQGQVASFFGNYVDVGSSLSGIPYESVVFYIICLLLNTWILSKGLSGGVEKAAKIGMPLLILFGVFLAVRGLTLGDSQAPEGCSDCDAFLGLNFLWQPQFNSLADPKVWLAAAGQIFFTLSLGMGTVHCYASYVKQKDDIALNAMSAGWMNEFVEVVLGASIVIPIAVGYLGLDWVQNNAGFAMAFQTMPYLFGKWGLILGTLAGVSWFGLLFFAGITSSLAMGTPWMGFMENEFNWGRKKSAWSFGLIVLVMGLPTVIFFENGVFDEYDYWAGTVSLVVFALAESIIFAWIYGVDEGWRELHRGADIKIPGIFKPIMLYVTPLLLFFVFTGALLTPVNNDWKTALAGNWELDESSIIGKITHKGVKWNRNWFSNTYESEAEGVVLDVVTKADGDADILIGEYKTILYHSDKKSETLDFGMPVLQGDSLAETAIIKFRAKIPSGNSISISKGQWIIEGDILATGSFVHKTFYLDGARILLSLLFIGIALLVYKATILRSQNQQK